MAKLKQHFGLTHVVMVGDRGMITKTQVSNVLQDSGLDWITALKAPTIKVLARQGVIQPSLFDQINLAEVSRISFPVNVWCCAATPIRLRSAPAGTASCWRLPTLSWPRSPKR